MSPDELERRASEPMTTADMVWLGFWITVLALCAVAVYLA